MAAANERRRDVTQQLDVIQMKMPLSGRPVAACLVESSVR
jgi:hypothetical protein